jgi:hypothetical protein
MKLRTVAAAAAAALSAAPAWAYPGGTPDYQTDVAPFCSSCHSSRNVEEMAGTGERAEKELAEKKHIAVILSGQKGYADLSEADRVMLADQIRALDKASTVQMDAPDSVTAGQTFQVTVSVTGGAGPVVGVSLVDRPHRWYGRPAASAGWRIAGPPVIIGPDGQPQTEWLAKRPDGLDRNISFVNVKGIHSDAAAGKWSSAKVIFTLQAPDRPGTYPLAAAYHYGTEKSTVLGYKTNAMGWKEVRGGFTGGSGRVLFTPLKSITVGAAQP